MKQYEPIGKYIHLADARNSDLSVTNLVGLTIEKRYIPSVANVIGTDLSKYKVIKQGQFACSLMQVSRDGKMPVAMYKGEPAIMSPAYPIFEVNDVNELMPEYLHMYLSRPEFDREAVFHAVGGVRGSLDWEDFISLKMPVPHIDEQRKIVGEYQAVEQRIENNNRLIKALEDTAQAIYHHTFVENIDPENLPDGWKWGMIKDFGTIITGKTPSTLDEENFGDDMPFVTIPDMHEKAYVFETERKLSIKGYMSQKNKTIPKDTICVSCIGTAGLVVITTEDCQTNQQINSILLKNERDLYYLYISLKGMKQMISEYGLGGSVFNNLNKADFEDLRIILPNKDIITNFYEKVTPLYQNIKILLREQIVLVKTKNLLLSKLS